LWVISNIQEEKSCFSFLLLKQVPVVKIQLVRVSPMASGVEMKTQPYSAASGFVL
jgi:hypothetical protein